MPIIDTSDFVPTVLYKNSHYNTFIPYLFGKSSDLTYKRKRIRTKDGDFLDIDCLSGGFRRLAIICHGLEGSSSSSYVRLMAKSMSELEWDVQCPNYRGCSGEMNLKLQMYNSGTTSDLDDIITHGVKGYDEVTLIGFSLGGNLVLKYAGEGIYNIPTSVKTIVAVSAPIHLSNSSQALLKPSNYLYQLNFLMTLFGKIRKKAKQFPGALNTSKLWRTYNLYDFDEHFTAPIFGYNSAEDYYADAMSLQFLETIRQPTLIINAGDDPFLGPLCYPYEIAKNSNIIHLMVPKYGGHVGFARTLNDRSFMLDQINSFVSKSHP